MAHSPVASRRIARSDAWPILVALRPVAAERGPQAILLVLFETDSSIVREACFHALGAAKNELFILFVDPHGRRPSPGSECRALESAALEGAARGIRILPMTRTSADPAEAVRRAAEEIRARIVIMNGAERGGLVARIRSRRLARKIRTRLSPDRSLLVYA